MCVYTHMYIYIYIYIYVTSSLQDSSKGPLQMGHALPCFNVFVSDQRPHLDPAIIEIKKQQRLNERGETSGHSFLSALDIDF